MSNKTLEGQLEHFCKKMKLRLTQKEQEGFYDYGAEDAYPDSDFILRIIRKLSKETLTDKDMVDVANYAMFLSLRHPL
jgi:hypothetical protein